MDVELSIIWSYILGKKGYALETCHQINLDEKFPSIFLKVKLKKFETYIRQTPIMTKKKKKKILP